MYTTTERVWETFHAPLQQFIRRRVSDDATAEDLLQDVFLKIHQHVETLKDVKKLESWIYQVDAQCHHRLLPQHQADNFSGCARGHAAAREPSR